MADPVEDNEEPSIHWVAAAPAVIDVPVARRVLGDCRIALHMLETDQPSGDKWRIYWVAIVALLRTVREALYRVEMESPAAHASVKAQIKAFLNNMAATKPEPKIYWGFIAEGANLVLHQHRFQAKQVVLHVSPEGQSLAEYSSSAITAAEPMFGRGPILGVRVEKQYMMKDGPFAGRDQRALVREAIEWWQSQLDAIVARAEAGTA